MIVDIPGVFDLTRLKFHCATCRAVFRVESHYEIENHFYVGNGTDVHIYEARCPMCGSSVSEKVNFKDQREVADNLKK